MEILSNNCANFKDIYCAMNNFRAENTKKIISEIFEKFSENKSLNYIGELNKNDAML